MRSGQTRKKIHSRWAVWPSSRPRRAGGTARHPGGGGGRPREDRAHALEARGVAGARASRGTSRASRRVVARRVAPSHSPTSRKVGTQTHLRGDRGEVAAVAGVLRQHGGPAGHERVDERHRDTRACVRARSRSDLEEAPGACLFVSTWCFSSEKIADAGDPSSTLRALSASLASRLSVFGTRRKNKKEPKTALTFQSGINLIEKTRLRASLRPVKSPDSRNALAEVREPGKTSPIRPAGTSFGEKPTKYTRRVR